MRKRKKKWKLFVLLWSLNKTSSKLSDAAEFWYGGGDDSIGSFSLYGEILLSIESSFGVIDQ